ncbi:transcriptional regulator [Vibrio galatheae]|uniref:Transcriptional regulator n=1 Tax=Vibrio galatheae TaxID=579748 RepID=A0A0F4NNE0_9VIBR|nr:LysR family transcriptional regulator [Vibrio galatheae]KJY84665.1 transcriptional regulator [Vibrio galatheae]
MRSDLDLNLLQVILLLARHKQLKAVAQELDKTESAISKNLSKLREQLGDPLFVRGSHELEPTSFTLRILPGIERGLEVIKQSIEGTEFDPVCYDKPIKLAIPSVVQYLIGKSLLIDLLSTFPNATIEFMNWNDSSAKLISEGTVEMGVQYFNEDLSKSLFQQTLGQCKASIVCAKRYSHRTLEQLFAMPFVMMEVKGWRHSQAAISVQLEKYGIQVDKIVTVDEMSCLFEMLEELEYAAFLPNLASLSQREYLSVKDIPSEMMGEGLPNVVSVSRLTHRNSPLHKLLYEKLKQHLF